MQLYCKTLLGVFLFSPFHVHLQISKLNLLKISSLEVFYVVKQATVNVKTFQRFLYTARFSLHQVHGSQCTKEYYTKYSWRTLAEVCMVSEVLHVVPRCRMLL